MARTVGSMRRKGFFKAKVVARRKITSSRRQHYRGRSKYRPSSSTPEDARIGPIQKLRRQGPRRSFGYQPLLKANSHRAESYYTWSSSIAGPANNPLSFIVNNLGSIGKPTSGSITSQGYYSGFDAYVQNSQNAPYSVTKCFYKGCKVKINLLNDKEIACKYRIVFCKLKKYMIGTTPTQWNSDVNRSVNTKHWKVIKMTQGVMEPKTYTDAGVANGATRIEKNFYISVNKWYKTNTADPSSNYQAWQLQTYAPQESIFMFVDTDDTNPSGSSITFSAYINDYFSTFESTQT